MARHRSRKSLPRGLVRLVHAATQSGTESGNVDVTGAADALREFGALARWALPVHGVFVPKNNDVDLVIGRIAKEHLGLGAARREFHRRLERRRAVRTSRCDRDGAQPRPERLRRGVLLRWSGVRGCLHGVFVNHHPEAGRIGRPASCREWLLNV